MSMRNTYLGRVLMWRSRWIMLPLVILLDALAHRKTVSKIWKDLWVTIEILQIFDKEFVNFWDRVEISQKYSDTLNKVLASRLMGDAWLLDWEDPEIRVEAFFLNVERDINRFLSELQTEDEALFRYFCSLRNTHTVSYTHLTLPTKA